MLGIGFGGVLVFSLVCGVVFFFAEGDEVGRRLVLGFRDGVFFVFLALLMFVFSLFVYWFAFFLLF